ncbi:putative ankyrin repeat protein [Hypoxylon crocopeplum]|nr:putative ankyrin repeat protein [Hypoxylon crocopeplum]
MADPHPVAKVASSTASNAQEQPEVEAPASDPVSNALDYAVGDNNQDAASVKTTTASLFSQCEESSSSESESRQHKLGLDINYPWGWSGSSYDDYDVITVHGVRDDYTTAWADNNGIWWVKEQLFKSLSIREIDYSYEIDEESTLYHPKGIKLHAERLIGEYAEVRGRLADTETDRPVIWICHDLGGTIVKEALYIAINNPSRYGKIAILTSAIIFLGTPHRFQSLDHLEDQLLKLILLPRPDIRERIWSKVKNLAHQVNSVNRRFLTTKILDRATIFNVFIQSSRDSLKRNLIDNDAANITELGGADDLVDPVTPFPRYAHDAGQSFEAAGRTRLDTTHHVDLVRGDPDNNWLSSVSGMFNVSGSIIKVSYGIIKFQARLLSLAPPTRAMDTPYYPELPTPPVIIWIRGQAPLIHLHGNGNSLVNVSRLSRLFYVYYDSDATSSPFVNEPHKTVVYFEFNQWDSRYSTVSSLLTYFINALTIAVELSYLNDTCSWSLEDLYHLYTTLRDVSLAAQELTFFIGCFDQCPKDQRQWLLGRILDEQSRSDAEYRLILSTSALDGLVVESFPDKARINLADCPAIGESSLASLIAHRQIYEDFRPQLENLLNECRDAPHLGHIILTWLRNYHRGKPRSEIADKINELSPATAENIVQVFVSSLIPELQPIAERVFNWVKHASEPWSPEALAEALAVHEFHDEGPLLNDLDGESMMSDIEAAFGGIIIVKNRDVRFSHPSFYNLPEVGIEGTADEWASRVNSTIAETCLRYFQLRAAQERLKESCQENFEGGPWDTPLDAAVISHRRISMAEYAIRFWPQHYKAGGRFKPSKLVHELFASKESRAAWEVPFWLLTNPFTRIQRSYISTLPVLAMLGLEDLVEEKVKSEKGQPSFDKDCWFAITEAARAGNEAIVQKLLKLTMVDEKELQTALFWAAAKSNTTIVNALVEKIPNMEAFQWPENILSRAATAGLDGLLATMLRSGCEINKISDYWKALLGVIVAWRDRVSTLEVLLNSGTALDLTLLLRHGASIEARDRQGQNLLQRAVRYGKYKAVDILIKAGADFKSGKMGDDAEFYLRPPLVVAADVDMRECLRILLNNKADPKVECATGSALYNAVTQNHEDIARLLLEHDPKPDMDVTPSGHVMLFIRAVCTGNTELIDFIDPNSILCKTPLSRACFEGNLEIVKLLLENKADINYTGGDSDTPLFASLYANKHEVANHLLQDEDIDVRWTANDGWGALHAAFNKPNIIPKILQKGASIDGHCLQGTVLHFKPECLKVLLKAGANPKFKNKNGDDAVDILLKTETDSKAAQECLKLLLSRRYNVAVDQFNEQGQTRLHSIREKTPVSIVQLLVEANAPLDDRDQDGYTPLAIAISKGNKSVAKYFIEQGASVNICGPGFGSIFHLAVIKGSLNLIKLLVDSGADLETVDLEYGESLLYTALGIKDDSKLKKTVRYLVDEAKVPIDKLGGELAYPIIRAADMTRTNHDTGTKMLKFLIRRRAQLNVADGQGRRAVHLACTSLHDDGIKALIDAGADIDVGDKFGRKPIHFAASSPHDDCISFLLDRFKDTGIVDIVDHDNWTPLLWAARSGHNDAVTKLVARGGDVWVRGHAYDAKAEWSALKLINFANQNTSLRHILEPKERIRTNQDGKREEWDDSFHKTKAGHKKDATCKSCSVTIIGIQWKCIKCADDFSLCFKCYGHQTDVHNPEHSFKKIKPLYEESTSSGYISKGSGNAQGVSEGEGEGNAQDIVDDHDEASYLAESFDEDELDLDLSDSDVED